MGIRVKVIWGLLAAGSIAFGFAACGSDSSGSPPAPSPGPPPGGGSGTTITIANNAVSPKNVTVTRGSQVTFVNNDTRPHEMDSDPHPAHTDCPEINQVGFLSAGQSKQTGNLNVARVCGYHDHEQPFVTGLQGTITIQ
jgi:plastocyanin